MASQESIQMLRLQWKALQLTNILDIQIEKKFEYFDLPALLFETYYGSLNFHRQASLLFLDRLIERFLHMQ